MAMTMADSVIRKACDRCHSQKLSCKRIGDEACERCVRLHAECKSSPSLRYKKQHQQHHQQQQQRQQRQRQRPKHRPRQIVLKQAAHAPAQSREAPMIHWMAQLSDINARLLDLASLLPQAPQQQQGAPCNGPKADAAGGFPVDEMFKLTRRVADILDRLSGNAPGDEGRLDGSDPGNSMFVLSTYVRLLDMYQRVFSLVRIELSQADADAGAAFKFWKLPDVTVDSFDVEPTPSLQMSLTIQLAEEFLVCLRNATAALDPALRPGADDQAPRGGPGGGDGGNSMFSDVVDVSYRAVRTKEETLARHLAELRVEIEAFLDP